MSKTHGEQCVMICGMIMMQGLSLFKCPHSGVGVHNCGHFDDATALCFFSRPELIPS